MVEPYLVPQWFFGFDVVFGLIFLVITLLVALYAFRVYKLSGQRNAKLLGTGFMFISTSYLLQTIINFAILERLEENSSGMMNIWKILILQNIGMYAHTIFFMMGLITLTYMTLKVENAKLYWLLFISIIISLSFSTNYLYLFYIMSCILMLFIVWHYLRHYLEHKDRYTMIILAAFILLLFSEIHFFVSLNHQFFYVLGRFLELVAYILILINLVWIIQSSKNILSKKQTKKKK